MRLGIYAFFDPEGIADVGDIYYLSAVAAEVDRLIIVVNGEISDGTYKNLARFSNEIHCRENKGYDACAFREVLLRHLPKETWSSVDELVLFNNTVFGPTRPLAPIFQRFSSASVDFWGMTLNSTPELPDHIQSYFLVFKKKVLQSPVFWKFWKGLRMNFTDVNYLISIYEIRLTKYLESAGFRWGGVQEVKECSIYGNPCLSLRLGAPVLKKKMFRDHGMSYENYLQTLSYLECEAPDLVPFVHACMERHHLRYLTNEEILERIRPFQKVYFYGLKVWSYYLMSELKDKEGVFVESDECYHGPKQGDWRVLRKSELPSQAPANSVLVVFLSKRNAGALRNELENIFHNVLYLYDPVSLWNG